MSDAYDVLRYGMFSSPDQIIQLERERIFNLEDYDEPVYIGPAAIKRYAILGQEFFNLYDSHGSVCGQIAYEFSNKF